ncbi:MAG TPA: zinc ribbon domain-containing protein [Gemmatimonadales bacterium]
MAAEVIAALALGGLVLWMILSPLFRTGVAAPAFLEPLDPEETRRGIALIALKEIDFDRATGKLSDQDYEGLKAKYTNEAVVAMREEEPSVDVVEALIAERVNLLQSTGGAPAAVQLCPTCGLRPEPDARFCSSCGGPVASRADCRVCHAALDPGSRFCSACGVQV